MCLTFFISFCSIWFARFQIFINELHSIWCKLLALSWLYHCAKKYDSRISSVAIKVPILQVVFLFWMQLWPLPTFFSLTFGWVLLFKKRTGHAVLFSFQKENPPKSEWKKVGKGQSFVNFWEKACNNQTFWCGCDAIGPELIWSPIIRSPNIWSPWTSCPLHFRSHWTNDPPTIGPLGQTVPNQPTKSMLCCLYSLNIYFLKQCPPCIVSPCLKKLST